MDSQTFACFSFLSKNNNLIYSALEGATYHVASVIVIPQNRAPPNYFDKRDLQRNSQAEQRISQVTLPALQRIFQVTFPRLLLFSRLFFYYDA